MEITDLTIGVALIAGAVGITLVLVNWRRRNKVADQFFAKHLQVDTTRFLLLGASVSLFGKSTTVEIQNGTHTWPSRVVLSKSLKELDKFIQKGGELRVIGIHGETEGLGICFIGSPKTTTCPEKGLTI